jgi:hypothetical protein
MVVRDELVEGAKQAPLPEEDEAIETLLPDRAHEALRVGVGIRHPDGHQHDPHPGALEDAAESVGPLAVQELRRPRRENKTLREERNVSKKAAARFARANLIG